MDRHIIIPHFWNVGTDGDKSLAEEDLGWGEPIRRDALSDDPEAVFRYVVEVVGLNILFYWLEDRRFYAIETEKTPIEVRRLYLNPHWSGGSEYSRFGAEGNPGTCSKGEILFTCESPTELWGKLRIEGIPIGDVLRRSVITDLD